MIKYIYIHGLNSSKESFKYKIIQNAFSNTECVEWHVDDNIDMQLELIAQHLFLKNLNYEDKIIIIGDSTGANFAYQLREKLKNVKVYAGLVLLNPLLSLESVYDPSVFPTSIKKYIIDIKDIDDSLLILSNNDEVLDNSFINRNMLYSTTVVKVDDVHRLLTFEKYINLIENYSKKI